MSGAYGPGNTGGLDDLFRKFDDIERRLRELEMPTGSQLAQAVAAIQALVTDLAAEVAALASSGIDWEGGVDTTATIATTGNVTASNVVADTVRGDVGIRSIGAYSNLLTTSYRSLWVTDTSGTGEFGYVPSSARFKQDVQPHQIDPTTWRTLQLVAFRYTAAVETLGENAAVEVGLIAEDVDALGLTWLVDYDDQGEPFGIKFERLALLLLPAVQTLDARLTAAENQLAALATSHL